MPGFDVIVLVFFAWLSGKHGSSLIFALVFTALTFVAAALGEDFYAFNATVNAVITFVYSSVYFWLMDFISDKKVLFYIVLLGGAALWAIGPQLYQRMA